MGIEAGDTVKHIIYKELSGGLEFNVIDIDGEMALCEYLNSKNQNEQNWFKIADLILVTKPQGGFRNAGEAM